MRVARGSAAAGGAAAAGEGASRGVRLRGRGLLRRGRLGDVLGPLVAVPPALSAGGLRVVVPAGCSHGAQPNRFDGGAGLRFRLVFVAIDWSGRRGPDQRRALWLGAARSEGALVRLEGRTRAELVDLLIAEADR